MRFRVTLNDGTAGIVAPNSFIDIISDVLVVNQDGIVEKVMQAVTKAPFLNVTNIDILEDKDVIE